MSYLLAKSDARRIPLPDGSVHCCVTSPPYFGLRDYGIDRQIGLEATPDEFVAAMVAVFREVRRVLRDDGTCWLNLGDSYNAYNTNRGPSNSLSARVDRAIPKVVGGVPGRSRDDRGAIGVCGHLGNAGHPGRCEVERADRRAQVLESRLTDGSLKPKDLIGIPWRVAFALQADGWWLRSDIIWSKPNPMPESVSDRPTKSHEYLFLLAKSERYYFDQDAVREPHEMRPQRRPNGRPLDETPRNGHPKQGWSTATRDEIGIDGHPLGRNLRSVFTCESQYVKMRSDLTSEQKSYVIGEMIRRGLL